MYTTSPAQSLWLEALPGESYPRLAGDRAVDVAVVGGGITGLTTALLLAYRGARVAVIEADRVGGGVTGNNTAKVTALQSTVYSSVQRAHGRQAAADYAAGSVAAVRQVAILAEQESIECDLVYRPALTVAVDEAELPKVHREAEAATDAGLPVVWAHEVDLPFLVRGAVRLDNSDCLRCTHLGCLLRFNGAERSWDCPCHGSRFDVDGSVLEGPAVRALPRRQLIDAPAGNRE